MERTRFCDATRRRVHSTSQRNDPAVASRIDATNSPPIRRRREDTFELIDDSFEEPAIPQSTQNTCNVRGRVSGRITSPRSRLLGDRPSSSTSLSKEEQERQDEEFARRIQEEEDRQVTGSRAIERTMTAEQIEAILGETVDHAHNTIVVARHQGRGIESGRARRRIAVLVSSDDDDDELSFTQHSTPLQPRRRVPPLRFQLDVNDMEDDNTDGEDNDTGSQLSADAGSDGSRNELEDSHLNLSNRDYEHDSFIASEDGDNDEVESSDEDSDSVRDSTNDDSASSSDDEFEIQRRRRDRTRNAVDLVMSIERTQLEREQEREHEVQETPDDETVIRSGDFGHCTICFEELPYDPVGCLYCQQLVGCRKCISRWWKLGRASRADSPLSLGQSGGNHRQCPLCRHEWDGQPEVTSMFFLSE